MKNIRAGWALFRIRLSDNMQYRLAGIAGAVVGSVWAAIEITVYMLFFRYGGIDEVNGMSLSQVISYSWYGQSIFMFIAISFDSEIREKIVSGDVGLELCRPLDMYTHWFCKNAAGRLSMLIWRGGFTFIIGNSMPFGYGMSPPPSVTALVCAILSTLLAFLLGTAYASLMCALRINIVWGDGPVYMLMLVSGILSGNYLPLQLWPDALQGILLIQPFAGTVDIPARLYVGSMPAGRLLQAVSTQCIWIVVFILLGRFVMRRRLSKIVVQGG